VLDPGRLYQPVAQTLKIVKMTPVLTFWTSMPFEVLIPIKKDDVGPRLLGF
jgi:hypothetical protein